MRSPRDTLAQGAARAGRHKVDPAIAQEGPAARWVSMRRKSHSTISTSSAEQSPAEHAALRVRHERAAPEAHAALAADPVRGAHEHAVRDRVAALTVFHDSRIAWFSASVSAVEIADRGG
jgi:hypothetical protein